MAVCSCGLDMKLRKKALVCEHCDGIRVHVIAGCIRCERLMPPKRPLP